MMRELVQLAERLEADGDLAPPGYKQPRTNVSWIIDLSNGDANLIETDLEVARPYKRRSGANTPPYLLADKGEYVLGLVDGDRDDRAVGRHARFVSLVEASFDQTKNPKVGKVLEFLKDPDLPTDRVADVEPGEFVTFRVDGDLVFEDPEVAKFWARHVEEEFVSEDEGPCSVCTAERPLLRKLPEDLNILNETPQLTSFNEDAFTSYGKEQTVNASICYQCGSRASKALNHLVDSEVNRLLVARGGDSGRSLENQLALFWLKDGQVETEQGDLVDIESAILATLGNWEDDEDGSLGLVEVEELLKVPWTSRAAGLRLDDDAFYLAVVSANKSRLTVREWFDLGVDELKDNLAGFLDAQRVVRPWGEDPEPVPIRTVIDALEVLPGSNSRRATDPNFVRGLLRTAYRGDAPPANLRSAIVNKVRNPGIWEKTWQIHALMAALRLTLNTIPSDEDDTVTPDTIGEELDTERTDPAYLCGRLFAELENLQRAALGNPNATIVDKYFGTASSAPASVFGNLMRSSQAHLGKLRKNREGAYYAIQESIEGIAGEIDDFPKTLDMEGQAKFSLGYYHQRAAHRAARQAHSAANDDTTEDDA